ncbi:hypothetical protein BUE80_DR012863, partial [Diplocarpon rosae]
MSSSSSSSTPSDANTTPATNGEDAAAAAAIAAMHQLLAHQKFRSEEAVQYFAIGISALIILSANIHWSRVLYRRYAAKGLRRSGLGQSQVSMARKARRALLQRVPPFPSLGHGILVVSYQLINVACLLSNMRYHSALQLAKRFGWMAIANIVLVTFLALKNTPLAFLTAYSHDRLNVLHRVAGYTTVLLILLHGILMSVASHEANLHHILEGQTAAYGITAGAAAVVSALCATFVRRARYELFYVSHVLMFIVLIISVGLHQPGLSNRVAIMTLLAGALWSSDRILRACRLLWYSYDNRAVITPLPRGGTRIVLSRSPSRAVPGTHCFLWIPQIRFAETHPFTIVSTSGASVTLVISAQHGFTDDLYRYALQNTGAVLRASIDGPYGAPPRCTEGADKLILLAGGSGASFTCGVALEAIKKLADRPHTTIDFIWTVREQENLSWFAEELAQLRASGRVNITLHATRPPPSSSQASLADDGATLVSPSSYHDVEKQLASADGQPEPWAFDLGSRPVPAPPGSAPSPTEAWSKCREPLAVLPGRPDVRGIIKNIVSAARDDERVAIAACGPEQLMQSVRRTAADCTTLTGPSIELHLE